MITTTNKVLAGVLALQVVLVAATWIPRTSQSETSHAVLGVEAESVSALEITSAPTDGEPADVLRLERGGGEWTIASAWGYPADTEKVEAVVESLVGLTVRSPIARTTASQKSLDVADEQYGRKVKVTADGTETELLLGAASSSTVHVRIAGEAAVYRGRGMSMYDVSDRVMTYADANYLDFDTSTLSSFSVRGGGVSLVLLKVDDVWSMEALPEGKMLDQVAVGRFIGDAAKIRMVEPVGKEVTAETGLAGMGTLRVEWTVETSDATDAGGYTLGAEDGSQVYVKSDQSAFVVMARTSDFASVREPPIEDWLVDAREPVEAEAEAP